MDELYKKATCTDLDPRTPYYRHYTLDTIHDFFCDITNEKWGSIIAIDEQATQVCDIGISADKKEAHIYLGTGYGEGAVVFIQDSDSLHIDAYLLSDPEIVLPDEQVMDFCIRDSEGVLVIRCQK